jgi:transposase
MPTSRKFYGVTHLLDQITQKLYIEQDLKTCFPQTYKQILSLAYYLTLEDNSPLYRFEKWNILHKHPYNTNIPSQRSSEIYTDITENQKNMFLKQFTTRHAKKECWLYDTTTIYSYSETLKQVQWGKNKEHDNLPQINLSLAYMEKTPIYPSITEN